MKAIPCLAAASVLAVSGFAAPPAAATAPQELTAEEFAADEATGQRLRPREGVITASEEKDFLKLMKSLSFPAYVYSGCNDRAHAAYLLLPSALKGKVNKIWVAAPAAFSAGVKGTISTPELQPGHGPVSWAFHVALLYRTAEGTKVYDTALSPDKPLSEAEWLGRLSLPKFTFVMRTSGAPYNFNQVRNTEALAASKAQWIGAYYTYDDAYFKEAWIPRALARDAVGVQLMRGNGCDYLKTYIKDPGKMQDFLLGKDPEQPDKPADPARLAQCSSSVELFGAERDKWMKAIPAQNYW